MKDTDAFLVDFAYQLTLQEVKILMTQNAISRIGFGYGRILWWNRLAGPRTARLAFLRSYERVET